MGLGQGQWWQLADDRVTADCSVPAAPPGSPLHPALPAVAVGPVKAGWGGSLGSVSGPSPSQGLRPMVTPRTTGLAGPASCVPLTHRIWGFPPPTQKCQPYPPKKNPAKKKRQGPCKFLLCGGKARAGTPGPCGGHDLCLLITWRVGLAEGGRDSGALGGEEGCHWSWALLTPAAPPATAPGVPGLRHELPDGQSRVHLCGDTRPSFQT